MKKSLNCVLGLLFVGVVSSASADVIRYDTKKVEPMPVKVCYDLLSKGMAVILKQEKLADGTINRTFFLTKENVFTMYYNDFSDLDEPFVEVICQKLKVKL